MVYDIKNLAAIDAGLKKQRAECHAGTRPWKFAPGEYPEWPDGLPGLTPAEAAWLRSWT